MHLLAIFLIFGLKYKTQILYTMQKVFWIVTFALLTACQANYTYTAKVADSSLGVSKEVEADNKITAMIAPYKSKLDDQMNEVIGKADKDLTRDFKDGESLLGNFCANLMVEQAKKYGGADLSVVTIGGLRVPIGEGDINVRLIYELMPFDNDFVIITISGDIVQKLLDRLTETDNTSLGNVEATVRRGKVVAASINGEKFDKNKTYKLAVSDYLANGGDYMDFLTQSTNTQNTGAKFRNVIIDHIKDLTKEGKKATATLGSCITYE